MHRVLRVLASAVLVSGFAAVAGAQQLPKTGSISVHSGYWAVGEAVTVADKHMQGHGNNRGITFNDKGSGPLHLGPTDCFYTFDAAGDRTKSKGYCTFGDTDGDRIFTDFAGGSTSDGYIQGTHSIDGGTGKYAGIQGSMAFKCKFAGANGELECTQRMDYKLP